MTAWPAATAVGARRCSSWTLPIETSRYNRAPELNPCERKALESLAASSGRWWDSPGEKARATRALDRLLRPLRDACAVIDGAAGSKDAAVAALLRSMAYHGRTFWGWGNATWTEVLGVNQAAFLRAHPHADGDSRQYMAAIGYLLGCLTDVRIMGSFKRIPLAFKVFGREQVEPALRAVRGALASWGYAASGHDDLCATVCETLLLNGSPRLEDLTAAFLDELRCGPGVSEERRSRLFQIGRALAALGILDHALPPGAGVLPEPAGVARVKPDDADAEWLAWVQRWEATSTLSASTRRGVRTCLVKAGRWLRDHHPDVTRPDQWSLDLAVAYVGAIDRMRIGDYTTRRSALRSRLGSPLSARAKEAYLGAMRQFFRDCQEWGWIPRRFDPGRALATPRSVKALIGPAPRAIADDIWAKLLWAGLNLSADDLVVHGGIRVARDLRDGSRATSATSSKHAVTGSTYYPLDLLRALAVVWLFAGLRADEITRLRVGCVRWQREDVTVPSTGETLSKGAVCLLDVPVHKTGHAFTKPVDPLVGEAIAAWERARPPQPALPDRKTGEPVQLLFCYRARGLTREFLNDSLIPLLCRKAGVPVQDARGSISSHRARSTIASQLFNARDPMSLFELQAWLGHRSAASTQHYVALTPTRLAKAYADAGYFARNVRAIEVLIDQEVVKSAAAAAGETWRYYDLGHGLCTYEFFAQCPHRLACARCDFYVPKASSRGQLLESKTGIVRFLQEIPLTDEERLAAEGDLAATDRLVSRLANEPTPSGHTPRELAATRSYVKKASVPAANST